MEADYEVASICSIRRLSCCHRLFLSVEPGGHLRDGRFSLASDNPKGVRVTSGRPVAKSFFFREHPMFLAYFLCMLLLLAAWVVMPLFPAILIYRSFPEAPLIVKGPLAGPLANLTINTGGAFAAYFLILLVMTPLVNRTSDAIRSATRPYWQISGEVTLVDETGKEIQATEALDQLLEKMDVNTRPNILAHDGTSLRFKIPEAEEGGLPSVVLSFPHTWSKTRVDFHEPPPWWMFWKWSEPMEKRDNFNKTIKLGKVLIQPEKPARTYLSLSDMDRPATKPAPEK
jgi:hypothetical protein